jgi:hypothetical protein
MAILIVSGDMTLPEAPSFGISSDSAFVVELDSFTGPLDLLLHLLREEQIDISDIPVARIAEQFLGAIHELGLNQAADYLEMASGCSASRRSCCCPGRAKKRAGRIRARSWCGGC